MTMSFERLVFRGVIWSVVLVASAVLEDIPDCDFFDTVNLTGSLKLANGSYQYENLIIPAALTGDYDYEIDFDGQRRPVQSHVRGCACQLRSCVRLCCHHKQLLDANQCAEAEEQDLPFDYSLNITQRDGRVRTVHILEDMVVQQELPLPCNFHYSLNAESSEDDNWTLFEDGTLLRHYDEARLSKQEYCMQPSSSISHRRYSLVPYNCAIERTQATSYVKLASVIFLGLTVGLYLWLPKLHSLLAKCCNLYFVCLMVAFLLNVHSILSVGPGFDCFLTGYLGYFATMATFLWLSVSCFVYWRTFSRIMSSPGGMIGPNFIAFNLVVWTTAGTMTVVTLLVDFFQPFPEELLPRIMFNCWIFTSSWSGLTYFYGPISLLVLFNLTMFVLTVIVICKARTAVSSLHNHRKRNRSMYVIYILITAPYSGKSILFFSYGVYLNLFCVMGGFWFLEILAFMCDRANVLTALVTANEYLNSGQGIIIFLVTLCNKEVLKLIRE
ncbi:hypothetical protein KR067_012539, partial [Drosophila pandora]